VRNKYTVQKQHMKPVMHSFSTRKHGTQTKMKPEAPQQETGRLEDGTMA
jgi:hypothetical protein